jgi:uncharacterized protein YjbI with pentapeptide repeats
MYKMQTNKYEENISVVICVLDNAFIPFDPANTDYANFKKEVLAGAELQDADGNVMTQEQANAYIASLP